MKTRLIISERWMTTILSVILLAMPQLVWGQLMNMAGYNETDFNVAPQQAFSWTSKGPGCIHLKLMVGAHDSDWEWRLRNGYFYVKDENGKDIDCVFLNDNTFNCSWNYSWAYVANCNLSASKLFNTNNRSYNTWYINHAPNNPVYITYTKIADQSGYMELDWYYPVEFAGKTLKWFVRGSIAEDINNKETVTMDYSKSLGTIEFDEISLETYDPIPGIEAADYGYLKIPVSCDRKIKKLEGTYLDSLNVEHKLEDVELEKSSSMAFLRVPSYEGIQSLTMTATLAAASWSNNDMSNEGWPTEHIVQVTKKLGSLPMLHGPQVLTSEMQDDGSIKLQWQISDLGHEDILDGDAFMVQRSLTGREEDYVDIGQEVFDVKKKFYEYTDQTFISSLDSTQIDKTIGIPLVRYRVVRASAAGIWGYEKNPAMAFTQPAINSLALLKPVKVKADWSKQTERKILVTWDYESSVYRITYVWDPRAEMRVVMLMDNDEGNRVDSVATVLTAEQIKAKQVELTLPRTCVNYTLTMEVDRKTSPIGNGKGDIFVTIGSDDEFKAFIRRVENGENKLNAILTADVNTPEMIDGSYYYSGNFNGNGYYLNVGGLAQNYKHSAPFRYVDDGVVLTNIKVKGAITSSEESTAALMGYQKGRAHIENCYVTGDMTITNTGGGAIWCGGMVGEAQGSLYISNSMVAARLNDGWVRAYYWGGFVGYKAKDAYVHIQGCFFNPRTTSFTDEKAMNEGSATFVNSYKTYVQWGVYQDSYYHSSFTGLLQGRPGDAPKNKLWYNGEPDIHRVSFTTNAHLGGGTYPVTLPDHRFKIENTGHVLKNSLTATTHHSAVELRWSCTEEPVDYFTVERRRKDRPNEWITVATEVTGLTYTDETVSPSYDYYYRIGSVVDCEGLKKSYTDETEGHCDHFGRLEGYLRFADGTGIPNVTLFIVSEDGEKVSRQVTTDAQGHFLADNLPYGGQETRTYKVTCSLPKSELSADCGDGIAVVFDGEPRGNMKSNVNFTVTAGVKMSGYVMYTGTSIPVKGASFLIDGKPVSTAAGPVETNYEGKYEFYMVKGEHSLQAVMQGHTFHQNGYYHADERDPESKTKYDFQTDKAGIYFYDNTRIKLIGRVVGGTDQGDLPLGNSLSKNNLGDNLKMVLTLEGDKTSMLVFENTDRTLTERDEEFIHQKHGRLDTDVHKTRVHTSRYRLELWPDPLTGEYEVLLPPVKWKIQQITADGYATLFQDGTTSEVIDLTDSLTLHKDVKTGDWMTLANESVHEVTEEYNAIYNRIYRAPIIFERNQVNWDNFSYFGERYYNMRTVVGDSRRIPIAYATTEKDAATGNEHGVTKYTFGYPVFSLDRPYNIKLSVLERYYYNNNPKDGRVEEVKLSGGHVTIHNGLESLMHRDTLSLDKNGEAIYALKVAQRPYIQTGEDALYTVSFSLDRDGMNYEAEPIQAYVFGQQSKPGAKDVVSTGTPVLVDVLRDPPGGGSSATLAKGSTLNMSYKMDMDWAAGVNINTTVGTDVENYTGMVVAINEAGIINHVTNFFDTEVGIIFSGKGERAFSYTMTANEDISTSSGATMVGADADLYIGMETSVVVRPMIALRAVTDSLYQLMQGGVKAGTVVEVASGVGEDGKQYHLIRDEVLGYGPQVKSTFVHSQQHILKQIIPNLDKQCNALMYTGTEAEAVAQANATGKPVYLSLIASPENPRFGATNLKVKDKKGEYVYYTLKNGQKNYAPTQEDMLNYIIVLPNDYDDSAKEDRVKDFGQAITAWAAMIAKNEEDKLSMGELVKNFDVDGGATVSYSESFQSEYSISQSYTWLGTDFSHNYLSFSDPFDEATAGETAGNVFAILGATIGKYLSGFTASKSFGKITSETQKPAGTTNVEVNVFGAKITFDISLVASYNTVPTSGTKKSYSRKESFNISMGKESHLNFDVYRVKLRDKTNEKVDATDVFYNENFLTYQDYVKYFLDRKVGSVSVTDGYAVAKGFVYRTRGGATARPWEDERKSLFYQTGTVIDERTKKIENPVIKMDKQSISGVPYGQPARFKLYLTNDSEAPEAVGISMTYFTLYQDNKQNPEGVKMTVDGLPLTQDGTTVHIEPGEVTEKVLEVWPGEAFDYENLVIGLISQGDIHVWSEATFDVHFLRQAGGVQIASPGNKWIMNTDAPMSGDQGWYMPVIISNFDRNQKGFDHIEFQYKESTRGDDYWTNLCSFYADSTYYKQASGTREMIPDNDNIVTKFYGDGREMEKAYDLRARLFVRNGSSYLTSDSEVLSGIKDTRRPQLFGSPDPKNGILGTGEHVVFNFSENIEYNYLSAITNFEVMGETNETALVEDPALLFDGNGYAQSEAIRNFSDKSVTIDLMIKPGISKGNKDMPVFSHGSDGNALQLWVKADRRLMARIIKAESETTELTSKYPIGENGLQHVALILDRNAKKLQLYCDSIIGEQEDVVYNGYGPLVFGSTHESDVSLRQHYKGKMQEARIWYRAMDNGLMSTYGKTHLTGYEMGLIDYYPMNEGKGDYASDKAQGAHLQLKGAAWVLPQSMSLRLDKSKEQKGLKLKPQYMQRPMEADYTLMFWFKTTQNGRGALLSNGSGQKTDTTPGTFYIGFEGEQLIYRTGGETYVVGKDSYDDDRWHHYAMTVNRSQQLANIYLDNTLKVQFSTDSLGGMTGNDFYLGNMVWHDQDNADVMRQSHALTGHIDGLYLFQQALPLSLIKRYTAKSPSGKEKGLITYLGFNRQERQSNNDLVLRPYCLNQVIHLDMNGNPTNRVDTVFVADHDYVMQQIDETEGAPVQAYEELRNLNFSFVGKDNQVLVNIDEPDARVNKRELYVTVYEIPDLNGNTTASPYSWSLYVDRNPLRWSQKVLNIKTKSNTEAEFLIDIVNNSGVSHTYTIQHLPAWITASQTTDIIGAKSEQSLTFIISSDVNTGTYDEIIYLTDENGLSEPLALNLTVEGEEPLWAVDNDLKKYSMNIVGRVKIGEDIVTDKHDLVGVFDGNGTCHGVTHIDYNPDTGESMVFLTVFDSVKTQRELVFRLWHYKTGKVMALEPSVGTIRFRVSEVVGTASKPVVFCASNMYIQMLALNKGWNWVSLNVTSNEFRNVPKWLSKYTWYNGDILIDQNSGMTAFYVDGDWPSSSGGDLTGYRLRPSTGYHIFATRSRVMEVEGYALSQPADRTVTVRSGWNSIGYAPMVNLPVATALADFLDKAEDGDVIKSREAFAMFSEGSTGGREWKGNLKYMKPGEGYMLYHKGEQVAFTYPFYEPGTFYMDGSTIASAKARKAAGYRMTMSLVAACRGVELQEGDRLLAFCDGELRGATSFSGEDEVLYMSIEGEGKGTLTFAIEHEGDIVATTTEVMSFEGNAISGTPDVPTDINFTRQDMGRADGWYTLQGVKLSAKPSVRGIYIYNGKKQIIK